MRSLCLWLKLEPSNIRNSRHFAFVTSSSFRRVLYCCLSELLLLLLLYWLRIGLAFHSSQIASWGEQGVLILPIVSSRSEFSFSPTMGQFHQRSTCSFYIHKLRAQLFCAYILGLYSRTRLLEQKLRVECWWNWPHV